MVAEGYKDTEIGAIPIEWEVKTLEDICIKKGLRRGPFGGALKKDIFVSDGYKIYEQKNAIKNDLEIGRYYITAEKYDEMKAFQVNENDFLISCSGTIGRIVKVKSPYKEGIINQALLKLTLNDNIVDDFFQFQFNSNRIQSLIVDNTQGGAMPNLVSMSIFRNTKFIIPTLKEQEKIADILSTADNKIDAIAIQIEKAETLKKGLSQKLLSEGIGHSVFKDSELGKIPDSWEVSKLETLVNIISGQSPSKFDLSGSEYKFFKVNQLNFCEKYLTNSEYAFDEKIDNLLDRGTVIFPKRGASIFTNKVRILTHKSFIDTNLMGLITNDTLNNMFLYYWLVEFELSNIADTSSVPQINNKHINPLKIPLPPLEEQKHIADILSTADEKLEVLRAKKERYETLKKGLLQKLLGGEIRV